MTSFFVRSFIFISHILTFLSRHANAVPTLGLHGSNPDPTTTHDLHHRTRVNRGPADVPRRHLYAGAFKSSNTVKEKESKETKKEEEDCTGKEGRRGCCRCWSEEEAFQRPAQTFVEDLLPICGLHRELAPSSVLCLTDYQSRAEY